MSTNLDICAVFGAVGTDIPESKFPTEKEHLHRIDDTGEYTRDNVLVGYSLRVDDIDTERGIVRVTDALVDPRIEQAFFERYGVRACTLYYIRVS